MSSGWRLLKLKQICVVDWGNTKLTKKAFVEDGRFLGVSAAGCDGRIEHFEHEKGTPVLSAIGAKCGRMFFPDEKFTAIKNTITLTPVDSEIINRFLYYLLTHVRLPQRGAGQPFISKGDIQNFEVCVPPLLEQKRIVAILDEAFEGIDTAIANTEKNLANARELFESYLNLVFSQKDEGWKELALKDVCKDYGRGKSKHRPRNDPQLYAGDYPFIQTGDVRRSDHLIKSFSKTYNKKGLAQSKLWPKGTICITIAANIAETGVLDFDACFPDSIIGVVVDEGQAEIAYVEFLLQSMKTILKAKGKGSAQDNINLGTFKNIKFPFPSLEIQKQIVSNVQELRLAIRDLEFIYQQKLNALAELKQSLLQKAFSGELTADFTEQEINEAVA